MDKHLHLIVVPLRMLVSQLFPPLLVNHHGNDPCSHGLRGQRITFMLVVRNLLQRILCMAPNERTFQRIHAWMAIR